MLPRQLRVGDLVDDYCPRERRLSDHAIVAMVGDEVRQVRCTACDGEHEYRQGKVPPSRRKKPGLPPPAPAPAAQAAASEPDQAPTEETQAVPAAPMAAAPATEAPAAPRPAAPAEEPAEPAAHVGGHDGPFHRRLIRATLPRIEGSEPTPRPIPEFTMHKAQTAHPHRHGKPFRPGLPGGPHRPGGGKGPGGPRHGGARHGQGPGQADGNTFGNRGGRGGHGGHGGPGGHGGAPGPRPSRHGFGHKSSRGPKKP